MTAVAVLSELQVRAIIREELTALLSEHTSRTGVGRQPSQLTIAEAAKVFRVSERTVRKWASLGRLDASRVALSGTSRVLITRSSVDALLASSAK